MKGKKAVKIVLYISVAGLFLTVAAVPAVYAAGAGMESGSDAAADGGSGDVTEETGEKTEGGKETTGESGYASGNLPGTDMEAEDGEETTGESRYASGNLPGTDMEAENGPDGLQVPEKLDIVLDPWEMDGKGQIYSGEYTIKNISGTKGTLRLAGIADGEDADIRPDGNGIRDGDGRNIFIEMVVNDEERITLLPEGAEYGTGLEDGESLTIIFTGKMNENAAGGWRGSGVEVMVAYDWEAEAEGNMAGEEEKAPGGNAVEKEETDGADMTAEGSAGEGKVPGPGPLTGAGKEEGTEPGTDTSAKGSGEDGAGMPAGESGKEEEDPGMDVTEGSSMEQISTAGGRGVNNG